MQNGQLRAVTLFIAGLMGLFGVLSAAAASHGADPRLLGGASAMCLAHAPALIALYARLAGHAHGSDCSSAAVNRNRPVRRRSDGRGISSAKGCFRCQHRQAVS